MAPIIQVQHIQKTFSDGVQVLKDISFDVNEGEVLGIIGPSGSGKSTLLRCISQLEKADNGTICICGQNLLKDGVYTDKKNARLINLNLGFVFQNFNLFPHLSVLNNIVDPQVAVLKTPKDQAVKKAQELLERVGLLEKQNNYPCELSGGQQQRVAIARALMLTPRILCFDEPPSALDPELTKEVLRVIKDLRTEGNTMIVVTHEMDFARDASDKVIFMANGIIEESGTPDKIFGSPESPLLTSFLNQ